MFVFLCQATAGGPCHGAAIYNEGSVYLRGGAVFSENLVSIDSDGYEAGDGGAVWNGPTGRLVVESTAVLRSNGVEAGGRGGALWNEGFVEFKGTAEFALNVVRSICDPAARRSNELLSRVRFCFRFV